MSDLEVSIISAIAGAVFASIIGAIAYFAKRHIEKADKGDIDNFIDGYERLKNISESKNPPSATSDEIQKLHTIVESLQQNIRTTDSKEDNTYGGAWTQADLNRIGGAEFVKADAHLNATYEKLMSYQDGSCAEAFVIAFEKWKEFRQDYSIFIAETYLGGSIAPLMYSTTAVTLTNQFNELLKSELEERMNR